MAWSSPTIVGMKPLPRSDHVATPYAGRYLLVFGGGSSAHCYQDLAVLDTENMEWFIPSTKGEAPSPRAGHAAAAVGDKWFIVGGGNNSSGAFVSLVPSGNGGELWLCFFCVVVVKRIGGYYVASARDVFYVMEPWLFI